MSDEPEENSKAYRQIQNLINKNQKQRFFFMLRNFTKEVHHEKQLNLANEKLTQNSNLWEQLAESQKRE